VAEAIVKVVTDLGGFLTLNDLKYHAEVGSQSVDPISIEFNGQGMSEHYATHSHDGLGAEGGIEVWEHPPNGQGIVALMALGILEELEKKGKIPNFKVEDHNSAK